MWIGRHERARRAIRKLARAQRRRHLDAFDARTLRESLECGVELTPLSDDRHTDLDEGQGIPTGHT